MPGALVSVAVVEGEKVGMGQELCIVEAMKMQNVLIAERDVTVAEVLVKAGETLVGDQPIMHFDVAQAAGACTASSK